MAKKKETGTVIAWVGAGGGKVNGKGHKRTFWSDRYILTEL